MNLENLKWIKKGFGDFLLTATIGITFVAVCYLVIAGLVSLGIPPTYASTIISLCLLFTGSMMFSYFEHKNKLLEDKRNEIITDIQQKIQKAKTNNEK